MGFIALMLALRTLVSSEALAQLAITEIMSDAATNCSGIWTSHPDFWELTNFGTNTLDLSGYRFRDGSNTDGAVRIDDGVTIGPGESVIFLRGGVTAPLDEAGFCAWWGLTSCPQVLVYDWGFGFDPLGEELWFWDAETNLVDYVQFGEVPKGKGVTFCNAPDSGRFGEFSEINVCGAFRAVQCDDVGSPGIAPCGPVPMIIREQPSSQTVAVGMDATFSLQADGLPHPRVHWFFNGLPRSSASGPTGKFSTVVNYAGSGLAWTPLPKVTDLIVSGVTPADAGQYFAVLDNGLERMTTAVAVLTVNTNPAAPEIDAPPAALRWPLLQGQPRTNLVVAPGQTAELSVLVRGYPLPIFEWSWSSDGSNFTAVSAWATNRTLIIANTQSNHAGIYRVVAENDQGSTNALARLTVKPKPRLRITEAMAWANDVRHSDWWELTNAGDEPVPLYGYRWDDRPGEIGSGPTITNDIVIQPGESVILTESASPQSFRAWWGPDNLPPRLNIIVYNANGLTEYGGDEINVWDPTETVKTNFIDSVGFGSARQGRSFWWDRDACSTIESEFGVPSVAGECGAFTAVEGGDVGSPGWTAWTPPYLTAIDRSGSVVQLEWKAQPGSSNRLQYSLTLAEPSSATEWVDLGIFSFSGASGIARTAIGNDRQRFYRLARVAPNVCPCVLAP